MSPPASPDRPRPWFTLPDELSAREPVEERGLPRDAVRLLVATPKAVVHARFRRLGEFLRPGDLLVVNTSATLPAAVDATRADGRPVVVHFSTGLDDGSWVVELRAPDGSGPRRDAREGEHVTLPAGVSLTLLEPRPGGTPTPGARLWRAHVAVEGRVTAYLSSHGRPISYGYLSGRWPLAAYQPVFARDPGSAEMASAGRPFTTSLVTELVAAGVLIAPVTLHAGVSSPEAGEPPQAERFDVPASTAELGNHVRRAGGRIVAVGTTVARALESAAGPDGTLRPAHGWTDLVLGPDRPARAVGGLLTGWHAPDASHLLLLEAVAGAPLVRRAYRAALAAGYRWHEFGDSCLLLPGAATVREPG